MRGFDMVPVRLGVSSFILLAFSLIQGYVVIALVCALIMLGSLCMMYGLFRRNSPFGIGNAIRTWLADQEESLESMFCLVVGTQSTGNFNSIFNHRDVDCLYQDIETELVQYFGRSHVRRVFRDLFIVLKEFPSPSSISDDDKSSYKRKVTCQISERIRIALASYDERVLPVENLAIGCAASGLRYRAKTMEQLLDLAYYTWNNAQGAHLPYLVADETLRARKLDIDECKQGFLTKGWQKEFNPFFQPIIDPSSYCIVGMESLARWQLGGFRLLEATIFKDLAGEMHRMSDIDAIIIKKTFAFVHKLNLEGVLPYGFRIVVNVSNESLADGFADYVEGLAAKFGLQPRFIEFDVQDSILRDPQGRATVKELREYGFRIALDVFDQQAFDLNTLFMADFDSLKLDFRAFDMQISRIFHSLQETAVELGLDTLAKGIETKQSMDMARMLGVNFLQGNYFTPPIPEETCKIFLRKYLKGLYLEEYEEGSELA